MDKPTYDVAVGTSMEMKMLCADALSVNLVKDFCIYLAYFNLALDGNRLFDVSAGHLKDACAGAPF